MDISIVIPSHNRKASLIQLLKSIKESDTETIQFEVIVVCDGCVDGTEKEIEAFQKQFSVLKYISQKGAGPAAARNNGAKLAQGKYIAFTDDDCLVSKEWLKAIITGFSKFPKVIGLQGKTLTNKKECTPLTHQIHNEAGHSAWPTCNVAYRKDYFERVGGFDESFPFAHNEDADIAWRLEKEGPMIFYSEMLIIHPPREESFKKLSKRMKMLESEFLLYHKDAKTYKEKRNSSPWVTIYWEVFLVHQFRQLKSRFKFIHKPKEFFLGLALNFYWWYELIALLPKYMAADKKYAKLYA
ncbi:glycosyltransferase family 2 protein [Sediminitomix flava]|uniref:GT2 family glycosyltransferase n=1 Tax=Sediminitomix flava TaxID=379075 RepID=A0A315ZTF7_SEDFL|nr:glycosyltransferase family A protein [Sediminitomix flava]PWJ38514.1 GT2 family glycosyltransferase [Sediminitomix flava]